MNVSKKGLFLLFVNILLLFLISCNIQNNSSDKAEKTQYQSRYERWVKSTVKNYPKPLEKGDSVFNWWPLTSNPTYKYRIVKSRWSFGDKWVGAEFSLKIKQDTNNKNNFLFDVQEFDEFPYKGLIIKDNRIFIVSNIEQPLIAFPLFDSLWFADEKYEFQFLKETVLNTSEESFYAPVSTSFWNVKELGDEKYRIHQVTLRGLYYIFQKNFGIIEWYIPGGYVIKLVSADKESNKL